MFFSCISSLLILYSHGSVPIWVKGITGDEWLHTLSAALLRSKGISKGTATLPRSAAAILSIVYFKKNTSFNRRSRSHASNDQNPLMLYYKKMITVLRSGNIIKQESKTKRRKQAVSKVIEAGSILLSWPYKCGTNGL